MFLITPCLVSLVLGSVKLRSRCIFIRDPLFSRSRQGHKIREIKVTQPIRFTVSANPDPPGKWPGIKSLVPEST